MSSSQNPCFVNALFYPVCSIKHNEPDHRLLMLILFVVVVQQAEYLIITHYKPYFINIIAGEFLVEAEILVMRFTSLYSIITMLIGHIVVRGNDAVFCVTN